MLVFVHPNHCHLMILAKLSDLGASHGLELQSIIISSTDYLLITPSDDSDTQTFSVLYMYLFMCNLYPTIDQSRLVPDSVWSLKFEPMDRIVRSQKTHQNLELSIYRANQILFQAFLPTHLSDFSLLEAQLQDSTLTNYVEEHGILQMFKLQTPRYWQVSTND